MAWCCQATSHYPSQCWPRSPSPYGIIRPQWVKISPQFVPLGSIDNKLTLVQVIVEKAASHHLHGLVQKRRNSSSLAMELCLSCTNPSILYQWWLNDKGLLHWHWHHLTVKPSEWSWRIWAKNDWYTITTKFELCTYFVRSSHHSVSPAVS